MFTGPAVLQLVDRGRVGLDDAAAGHVDPALARLGGATLVGLLGPVVSKPPPPMMPGGRAGALTAPEMTVRSALASSVKGMEHALMTQTQLAAKEDTTRVVAWHKECEIALWCARLRKLLSYGDGCEYGCGNQGNRGGPPPATSYITP